MKRSNRQQIAEETVSILHRGDYVTPTGKFVSIADLVQSCREATRYFTPDDLESLRARTHSVPATHTTSIEVVNETTLQGIASLLGQSTSPVAALNFASAKNPGGGFLNGSQAQEESLARSSALYSSLLRVPQYYQGHRSQSSCLYSDAMILSPNCPVFRSDEGKLLDSPQLVTFITSAAPNAGAIRNSAERAKIPRVLKQRAESVLTLAATHGYTRLILGAWGCGVFRNDPSMVAEIFAELLNRKDWKGRFEQIRFSVLDTSEAGATFAAFAERLG
jgi:uncharacterized protein (TIGR02452 family)